MDKKEHATAEGEPRTGSAEEDGVEGQGPSGSKPGFTVHDRRFWALPEEELEAGGERLSAPTFVEQLKNDLEKKDAQLKEYIAAYKREVVEGLEKTKQRLERDALQRAELLRGQMVEPMLDVLEALDRTLLAAEAGGGGGALLEGVRLVQKLMVTKLQEMGLQRIETVGQPFDPSRHDAVSVAVVDDPAKAGRVVAELKAGFTLGARVLRAAFVQVAKLG